METRKKALGRGLEQLFNGENLDVDSIERQIYASSSTEEIIDVNLDELRANPYQPRKVFKDEALKELSESIKEHGVFQPIIIKKSIKGYEIIAGERRVRASRMAGLTKIPAIVRNFTDEQMMEIALLENLQRENLSAIEEAIAYKSMLEKLELTQDELSHKVGKSRSHITNILGLLRLPASVQAMVADGSISMGHARALSKLENEDKIVDMARELIDSKISVRELEEKLNNNNLEKKVPIKRNNNEKTHEYDYIRDAISEKFDAKCKIKDKKIEIMFNNNADLNRILEIMDIKV